MNATVKALAEIGFDEDNWGVGVSGVVNDPSPFPRINRLRNWYYESGWTVDSERALLATEAYQKYSDEPQQIKVASTLAHILRNVTLQIADGQLLVGDCAAPPKSCPIYPEFSYQWIVNELKGDGPPVLRERPNNCYTYSDKVRDDLLGIADYWQGKTVSDTILSRMTPEEMKGDFMGIMLYSTSLYHFAGVGHLVADTDRLFKLGYAGIRSLVQEKLAALPEGDERSIFYRAQLIVLDAAMDYIHRYAELARSKAVNAEGARRDELVQMADNLDHIAEQPPQTFWQALQLTHLAWSLIIIESNGHSVSYGRLDQTLLPYFQNDIKNGVKKDFIQEVIECLAALNTNFMKLRDWLTTQANSGRALGTSTVTIGGVDGDGNDATNELSDMFIDMVAHTRLGHPWMAARIHKNTPDRFAQKIAKAMRMGTGEPKIFSDEACIKAMRNRGVSLEDARNFVVVGCVELSVPGKEYGWHDSAYFSIARVLELAMNDGYALGHQDKGRLGPATGRLEDFASFDELKKSYEEQMIYWVDIHARGTNIMDDVHRELKPLPYLSLLIDDCIAKGQDVNTGAAVYNFTGPQCTGVGSTADCLSVIKQLVFEEKRVSAAELQAAVQANWEGHESLYHLVNSDKVHHYGNDDDYADELAIYATDIYCDAVEGIPNPRGGVFQPGVYTVSANVPFGMVQAASAEGRKNHEPLSDCIGPVHTYVASHDRKGPTAVIKSAGKLHQERMSNGTLLNLRFSPSTLSGDSGVNNLVSLYRSYFKAGQEMQLNVISGALLKDAYKNPDKYRGLMVRVAGYSAHWSELSDELRRDIMTRTEMSFD
ncbi:glycyl radical protein [Desulforhopalus singaporensis]|uniref:Formate C-acetyltransferase n=1 Tax=Desulforhopalus singaporensis TaxID=91360 RepID=A0A1H0LT44_9BACT|nr:pyruvate formate lyase family protein [Desulforhopalus singaporensis]SDO71368.1 formate C-acetyltransferase [Desulforhopalus singaporensis]